MVARRGLAVGVDRTADTLTGDIFTGSFLSGIRRELCVTEAAARANELNPEPS